MKNAYGLWAGTVLVIVLLYLWKAPTFVTWMINTAMGTEFSIHGPKQWFAWHLLIFFAFNRFCSGGHE